MISITTLSSKTISITIIKNDTHHYHKKRYPSLIIRNDIHRYTIKNGIHHYTIIKYDIHHYTIIKNSDGTYENNDGNSDIGSDALHSRQKNADSWRQSVQHDRCDRCHLRMGCCGAHHGIAEFLETLVGSRS